MFRLEYQAVSVVRGTRMSACRACMYRKGMMLDTHFKRYQWMSSDRGECLSQALGKWSPMALRQRTRPQALLRSLPLDSVAKLASDQFNWRLTLTHLLFFGCWVATWNSHLLDISYLLACNEAFALPTSHGMYKNQLALPSNCHP